MTVAERKERWRGARHWMMRLLAVFSLLYIPLEWWPKSPWYVAVPMIAVQSIVIFGYVMHFREMCEKCIATMPLDPQKAIDKEKPLLWITHKWWLRVGLLVASIATGALTKSTTVTHMACNSGYDVWFSFTIFAQLRHSRLEPWCPWCRRGGGGDDESEEVPDPTDGKSKPVPA